MAEPRCSFTGLSKTAPLQLKSPALWIAADSRLQEAGFRLAGSQKLTKDSQRKNDHFHLSVRIAQVASGSNGAAGSHFGGRSS